MFSFLLKNLWLWVLFSSVHKSPTQVYYQYEYLSELCYACVRLGHLSFECPVITCPPNSGIYGPKLKAKSPFANRVELLLPLRSPLVSPATSRISFQVLAPSSSESIRVPCIGDSSQLSPTRSNVNFHTKLAHPIARADNFDTTCEPDTNNTRN